MHAFIDYYVIPWGALALLAFAAYWIADFLVTAVCESD